MHHGDHGNLAARPGKRQQQAIIVAVDAVYDLFDVVVIQQSAIRPVFAMLYSDCNALQYCLLSSWPRRRPAIGLPSSQVSARVSAG